MPCKSCPPLFAFDSIRPAETRCQAPYLQTIFKNNLAVPFMSIVTFDYEAAEGANILQRCRRW